MRTVWLLLAALAVWSAGYAADGARQAAGTGRPDARSPGFGGGREALLDLPSSLPFSVAKLPPGTLTHRDDICRITELVVIATVISREEFVEQAGRVQLPRTRVKLFAERVVRGSTAPHFELTVSGGRIGEYDYPGTAPELAAGQRYLMLLKRHPKWGLTILGGGPGAVRLGEEARLPGTAQLEMLWEQACAMPLSVPQRTFEQDR